MKISEKELVREAGTTGFRAEMLEKVWQLMNILDGIQEHIFLRDRLVLKGGTALNLFFFNLPRLSVDIDLNYVGAVERSQMQAERQDVERSLESIFLRHGLSVHRTPNKHAGGKWQLKYLSALGGNGNLEVDVNFMFRIPLVEVIKKQSCQVGARQSRPVALLDIHELGAGKLAALFGRHASRDLFDAHELLSYPNINFKALKLLSIIYSAMSGKDWRKISLDTIQFEKKEVSQQLIPVLQKNKFKESSNLTEDLLQGCKQALGKFFPLQSNEIEFLTLFFDYGKIDASLLTQEEGLRGKIESHPLLRWQVLKNER